VTGCHVMACWLPVYIRINKTLPAEKGSPCRRLRLVTVTMVHIAHTTHTTPIVTEKRKGVQDVYFPLSLCFFLMFDFAT
jgi:hypothetical protein